METIPRRSSPWTENTRSLKREAILEAARGVFEEAGLEGASMRTIAQRAGCTTGAIYPLFESKEQIYAELLRPSLLALREAVREAVARADPALAHEAAAAAFLHYYRAHPFELTLGLYAFRGPKRQGVGKEMDQILNGLLADAVHLMSAEGAKGDLRTPDAEAMTTFAQIIGLLVLDLSGRLTLGPLDALSLLKGYLKSRPPASPPKTLAKKTRSRK
jgi:AcrR family transcriptional regulator